MDVDLTSTNRAVQGYRRYLEEGGKKDPRSDIELTLELGDMMRQRNDASLEQRDPDFRAQYLAAKQSTDRGLGGEVWAGAARGARGLAGTAIGATALGASALGLNDTAQSLADKAKDVEQGGADNAPTVDTLSDVQDVGGAVRYGLGKVGEAAPSIGEAILSGVIGAAVGTAAEPGVGTVAGGVGGFIAKQTIKNLIKKGVAGLAEGATEAEVRTALKATANSALRSAFKTEAHAVAQRLGSAAVTGANSYALSAGEIYNDTGDTKLALGAGALAAIPDTIVPQMVLKRFFKGAVTKEMAEKAGTFFSRLAKDAAKEIPIEAGTEAFQELVGIAAQKYKNGDPATLTDADITRIREAAVGGAAGGLLAAPLGAAHGSDVTSSPQITPDARQQQVLEARRRAMTAPDPTAVPPATTQSSIIRGLSKLPPDQQDARLTVLQNIQTKRTTAEEAEMGVLQALVSQRPPEVAKTAEVAPPAELPPVEPPAAPAAPAADIVPPPPTPLIAPAPAAPVVEVTPPEPAKPASTQTADLARRTRDAGSRLSKLMTTVPSLDVSEARNLLTGMAEAGSVNQDALAALEAKLTDLETKSVAEVARVAAERAALAGDTAKKKAELATKKEQAAAERAAKELQRLADKAAKKIAPEQPVVAPVETPAAPIDTTTPAPATEAPAVAQPSPLANELGKALSATAPSVRTTPFSFGKITNDSKLLGETELPDLTGAMSDKSGRANTRIAVALVAPDGSVILKGVTPYNTTKGLKKVGDANAGYGSGHAVQMMGKLKGANNRKDTKVIDVTGNQQVLLTDLVAAGYKPYAQVNFDGDPGVISESFPTLGDFKAAWDNTDKVAVGEARRTARQTAASTAIAEGNVGAAKNDADRMTAQMSKLATQLEDVSLKPRARQAIESQIGRLKTQLDTLAKTNQSTADVAIDAAPNAAVVAAPEVFDQGPPVIDSTPGGQIAAFLGARPDLLDDVTQRMATRKGDLTAKAAALTNSFLAKSIATPLGLEPAVVQQHLTAAWQGAKTGPRTDESVFRALAQRADPLAVELDFAKAPLGGLQGLTSLGKSEQTARGAMYAQEFSDLINRLRSQGHDISLLEKALLTGEHTTEASGWYNINNRRIFIVMDDVAAGNIYHIDTLIHEMGHKLFDTLTPAQSQALLRAAENTISSVRDGEQVMAPSNANASPEEKIVSTLGIKLAEEGFGAKSATMAQAIWRTVKELYYRTANALLNSIGVNPGDEFVTSWFENSLRRVIGGDLDYRFADLLSPFREARVDRAGRFARTGGAPVADFLDPITNAVVQPEVVPDSIEAADWNIDHATKFSLDPKGETPEMDYTAAMSRITAAAWNEIIPIINELKQTLGKNFTDTQFWARFARGDVPQKILDRMESRSPGAAITKLGDAVMTEPMTQKARLQAYTVASSLAARARRMFASKTELANAKGDQLVADANRLNKTERLFRDAAAMQEHFNETMRTNLKEFSADLDRGPDTAFAAGKLMGAVREAERLTDDQAIPAEYQRVFKTILDGDGTTSLFDKLQAIAKLDLNLSGMTVAEVMEAIKQNAPKDANLRSLVENRPLFVALSSLARNSTREMDLLQLRVLKNTTQYLAIKAQLDEIRTATDARLDQMAKDIPIGQKNQGLADRLRGEFLKARREFRSTQRVIQRAEEAADLNRQVADRMQEKATSLSRDIGAFSSWIAHDGAQYTAMQVGEDGKWKSVQRTLAMLGPDIGSQREQIRHDLLQNQLWLEAHQTEAGSRVYEEVKRQTYELGVSGIGEREYRAAHRFLLDKLLQPLGQKFDSTGTAGGHAIHQMLNRWQVITKTHADEVEARARRWTHAFKAAREAAGYKYDTEFMQQVFDPVVYAIESAPGLDEEAALRTGVRAALARIPESNTRAENFGEKLNDLMRATKEISERMQSIAERQGVYVADKRLKDPLTGKDNLQRHAIKYGWLTNSRKLRSEVIQMLEHNMTAAGWTDGMFDGLVEGELDEAGWRELVDHNFTPIVKEKFVEPFVNKPGKEVFFGADDNGEPAYVSQLLAQEVWEDSGKDVLKFIDALYDRTSNDADRAGLPEYRKAMLQRFAALYKMESKLAAKVDQTRDPENPSGPKSHRIMDSRTNDLIPPEHFRYDVYDPTSARIGLAEIAYHAAFGRDGAALDKSMLDLKTDLKRASRDYLSLTGSTANKRRQATELGIDFKRVERAAMDLKRVDGMHQQLTTYFGGKNVSGFAAEGRVMLELLQLNTQLVLNQPKSGLWNLLSTTDFPIVFRGINKSSLRAVAFAGQALAKNVFGSLLESANINILHSSEYAKWIGSVNETRETERLPMGIFMSDIGKGGAFENQSVTPVIRGIQQGMRKGVKFGKGNEFAGNNLFWAPFNYINTQVASANGVATVQTFELMVKKAANFFADNPAALNDPAFRFTAEDLGMKGTFSFFSDEGAFDFFKRAAQEYRLGSFEDVVRGALPRMARGETIVSKEQALALAQMANNELSLESGINSRPAAMFNNPVLRLGGLLMGWPLAKMNQVNQSLKTSEGQVEMMSVLKGLGVMAAWSLPIGLAYSMLMDRYDEDILGKKSNLRGIDPIAGVPIIGPVAAIFGGQRGARENILGMLERTAKAGNVYGMGADMLNSLTNFVDPTSGQRDFDLNSRVLAYSQYANVRDTIRNLVAQHGAVTYSSVIRPLLSSMGGNGILQYQQILNNAFDLSNAEQELTKRTNVLAYLRAAGREAEIELKAGAGKSSPTPTSVWVREMQLAALSNDRLGFLEAYHSAVQAARDAGDDDPEQKILESWKARDPIKSVFATANLSPTDERKLNVALGDDGRRVVRESEDLYARYTGMIAPSPMAVAMKREMKAQVRAYSPPDAMTLRRQMAAKVMGY